MAESQPIARPPDAREAASLPAAIRTPNLVRPPVFLHAGWRTAGTFVWSRFRAREGIRGYYEPLHESLASVRPATLARHGPHLWASGHPRLTRSYFDEFGPLLNDSTPGVRGYAGRFATDDFFAGPDAALPRLQAYLRLLVDSAAERDEQPVFKFCRSLGRAGWMAKRFPEAVHIALVRNPVSQFISARHQYVVHDNGYFLTMPLVVLARNRACERVEAALRSFNVRLPRAAADDDLERAMAALELHLRRTEPETWYDGFLAFWLLAVLGTPETIDAIIDADLLLSSPAYRADCEADLAMLTGLALHLDNDRASSCCAGRLDDRLGFPRTSLWRRHATAAALLVAEVGEDWADRFPGGRIAAMLTFGTLLGMDRGPLLQARGSTRIDEWDALAAYAERTGADAKRASRRAERAERQLAAVYQSRSWRTTAALRWFGRLARRIVY